MASSARSGVVMARRSSTRTVTARVCCTVVMRSPFIDKATVCAIIGALQACYGTVNSGARAPELEFMNPLKLLESNEHSHADDIVVVVHRRAARRTAGSAVGRRSCQYCLAGHGARAQDGFFEVCVVNREGQVL